MRAKRYILPLRIDRDDGPSNPRLLKMAEAYLKEATGSIIRLDYETTKRLWVEIEAKEGSDLRVTGVVGLNYVPDVPVFHTSTPATSKALARRILSYLADTPGFGETAFVYVNPESEKQWEIFLQGLAAKKAYRWKFPIGPRLEV